MKSIFCIFIFSLFALMLQAQSQSQNPTPGAFNISAQKDGEYIVVKIQPVSVSIPANTSLTNLNITIYWLSSYQTDLDLNTLISPFGVTLSGPKGYYGTIDLRAFAITTPITIGPWIGPTEIMRIKTMLNSPSHLVGNFAIHPFFDAASNGPINAGPTGNIDPSPYIEFASFYQYIMDVTTAAQNVPLFRCNSDAVKTTTAHAVCPNTNGGQISINSTAPVSNYSWSNGTNNGTGTGQNINNLSQGIYNITTTLSNTCKQNDTAIIVSPCGLKLSTKVFLDNVNPATQLMPSNLALMSSFPTDDPYSAAPFNTKFSHVNNTSLKKTAKSVINTGNNNSIIDWVIVELRQGTQHSTTVAYTRSALLQKDGDIVDMDGVSPLTFKDAINGNYYISIKHRNHLGIRTLNAFNLTNNGGGLSLNFTNNTVPVYGSNKFILRTFGPTNIYSLVGGDFNFDGAIDANDYIQWNDENGLSQNYSNNADYNADGIIDTFDLLYWELNNGLYEEIF